MSISCILPTARNNFPVIGLPDIHVLQPTLYSLEKQTFRDFELIIVDALYPDKKEWIEERKWSFPIKYVPPHPNHRFWLDRKRWGLCGMLNTAILYCNGELIVRIDDCSQFKEDFLQKFWEGFGQGYFPLAMHTRYRAGRQAYYNSNYRMEGYDFAREGPNRQKILSLVYNEGDPIRDTRWPIVEKQGGRMTAPPQWFYGYSSLSLEAALKVNGFNELMDGQKGQEDQEMGLRLWMAGYKDMFLLNVDHWVIEHEHESIPADVIAGVEPIVCNYGIYLLNESYGRWRANCERLTLQNCEWIRSKICPRCGNYQRCLKEMLKGRFYIEGEDFNTWISNQNVFDLREERLEV